MERPEPTALGEMEDDTRREPRVLRVAHLADVHIRKDRLEEHKAVERILVKNLREDHPDVIIVAGDVFDVKAHATPLVIESVGDFLAALVEISPVILIAGNHDTRDVVPCPDPERRSFDLLTAVTRHDRRLNSLLYLRDTGTYRWPPSESSTGGVSGTSAPVTPARLVISVAAVDSRALPSDGMLENAHRLAVEYGAPRVLLFHQEVGGAVLPNGHALSEHPRVPLTRSFRDVFDACFGGHIHKRQCLGSVARPTWYPGSLLQQNIGESHDEHGYLLHTLRTTPVAGMLPAVTCTTLQRDIIPPHGGFVRICIDSDGRDLTVIGRLPPNPSYWDVETRVAPEDARVKACIARYCEHFGKEQRAVRFIAAAIDRSGSSASVAAAGSAAPDTHESALERHVRIIQKRFEDNPDLASRVEALHREHWSDARMPERKVIRLTSLHFSNLFNFQGPYKVNFELLEGGITGIVGENFTGKSAILDILAFALYDKGALRAPSPYDIVRHGAASGFVRLDFTVNGESCCIQKKLIRASSRSTEVTYRGVGAQLSHGTTDALKMIAGDVGSFMDARTLSFMPQNSGGSDVHLQGDYKTTAAQSNHRRPLIARLLGVSMAAIVSKVEEERNNFMSDLRIVNRDAIDLELLRSDVEERKHAESVSRAAVRGAKAAKSAAESNVIDLRQSRNTLLSAWDTKAGAVFMCEADAIAFKASLSRSVTSTRDFDSEAACATARRAIEGAIIACRLIDIDATASTAVTACHDVIRSTSYAMQHYQLERFARLSSSGDQRVENNAAFDSRCLAFKKVCEKKIEADTTLRHAQTSFDNAKKAADAARTANAGKHSDEHFLACWPIQRASLERPVPGAASIALQRLVEAAKFYASRSRGDDDLAAVAILAAQEVCHDPVHAKIAAFVSSLHDLLQRAMRSQLEVQRAQAQSLELEQKLAQCASGTWPISARGNIDSADADVSDATAAVVVRVLERLSGIICRADHTSCEVAAAIKLERAKFGDPHALRASAAFAQACAALDSILSIASRDLAALFFEDAVTTSLKAAERALNMLNDCLTRIAAASFWYLQDSSIRAAQIDHAAAAADKLTDAKKKLSEAELIFQLATDEENKMGAVLRRAAERRRDAGINALTSLEESAKAETKERCAQLRLDWYSNVVPAEQNLAAAEIILATQMRALSDEKSKRSAAKQRARDAFLRYNAAMENDQKRKRLQDNVDALVAYLSVLKDSGGDELTIPSAILREARLSIQSGINEVLQGIASGISVVLDHSYDLRVEPELVDGQGVFRLPVALASGYQQFVVSLAFRIALSKLPLVECPILDALVIDEGVSVADSQRLPLIGDMLESLMASVSAPRLLLLISHSSELERCYAFSLRVERSPGGPSRLLGDAVVSQVGGHQEQQMNSLSSSMTTARRMHSESALSGSSRSGLVKHLRPTAPATSAVLARSQSTAFSAMSTLATSSPFRLAPSFRRGASLGYPQSSSSTSLLLPDTATLDSIVEPTGLRRADRMRGAAPSVPFSDAAATSSTGCPPSVAPPPPSLTRSARPESSGDVHREAYLPEQPGPKKKLRAHSPPDRQRVQIAVPPTAPHQQQLRPSDDEVIDLTEDLK